MYNTHPTIIDQNSNFYNESAKLACIFNDISVKQESIKTQSAPEQVERVWVSASEGARRDFGRIIHTPPPEAHELRGAQLSIFINCARVFSFIQIIYENTPSSEPDELSIILVSGSWRVLPYLDAVFKPIKDGINNWLRDIGNKIQIVISDYQSSGTIDDEIIGDLGNAIFGNIFIKIIMTLLTVVGCIVTLVTAFTTIVSTLLSSVIDFVSNFVINTFASSLGGYGEIIASIQSGNIIKPIKTVLGISDQENSKGDFIPNMSLINLIFSLAITIFSSAAFIVAAKNFDLALDMDSEEYGKVTERSSFTYDVKILAGKALVLSIIGLIFAFTALPNWDPLGQVLFSIIGIFISSFALVKSAQALKYGGLDVWSGTSLAAGIAAVILSIITIIDTFITVSNNENG